MASREQVCSFVLVIAALDTMTVRDANNAATPKPFNQVTMSTTTKMTTKLSNASGGSNFTWKWERTIFTGIICVPANDDSKKACANLGSILSNYPVYQFNDLRNISSSLCVYLTDGPPKNKSSDHDIKRCMVNGIYSTNGTQDDFSFHFYNEENNITTAIVVIEYWGKANIDNNTVATPM